MKKFMSAILLGLLLLLANTTNAQICTFKYYGVSFRIPNDMKIGYKTTNNNVIFTANNLATYKDNRLEPALIVTFAGEIGNQAESIRKYGPNIWYIVANMPKSDRDNFLHRTFGESTDTSVTYYEGKEKIEDNYYYVVKSHDKISGVDMDTVIASTMLNNKMLVFGISTTPGSYEYYKILSSLKAI